MKFVTQDYYEILNVAPGASNEDVKRAYRMVRQSFRPDSLAIHSLYSPEETEAISAKIDEAFRILSSPESSRRYGKYHRAGRVGMRVPRTPDQFFDQVHALDEPSPIEQLARHLGRRRPQPPEAVEEPEEELSLPRRRNPSELLEPEASVGTGSLGTSSTGSLPVRPAFLALTPVEPVAPVAPAPIPLAPAEPRQAVASVELLLDSLEELPDEPAAAPVLRSPAPAPVRTAAQAPMGPSAGVGGLLSAPKLSSVRGRGLEVAAEGPRTLDPTTRRLPGAEVDDRQQAPTLASLPPVQGNLAPQPEHRSRRWQRETVRTRAVGPLSVEPPASEVLESLEADCGGINGEFLRQVRREANIALEDIADRTKISLSTLRAIEDDRLDMLPAKVYLKGYLSQMCRLLKLPVPEIPDRYLSGHGVG